MDGLLSSEAPAFEPVGVEGADPYGFEPAELGRLLGQVRRLATVIDFRHRPHPNPNPNGRWTRTTLTWLARSTRRERRTPTSGAAASRPPPQAQARWVALACRSRLPS